MLAESGHRDSLVVAWQNRWRGAVVAVLALIAFLFVVYRWVFPVVAEYAALQVPLAWEESLGREATAFLEKRIFSETQLSQERRDAIADRFSTSRRRTEATTRSAFAPRRSGPTRWRCRAG